jgi:hypothetical protein
MALLLCRRRKEAVVYEGGSLRRDACGLTVDDWACFLGDSLCGYSGPILLWWALVGKPTDDGAEAMSGYPFPDLLAALAADARVLAELSSSSIRDDVRALAPALRNLYRRIDAAAEIAHRLEANPDEIKRHAAVRAESSRQPALPSLEVDSLRAR